MEKVNGISIKSDWIYDLVKVSDLIYYDGPLLSHYQSLSGEDYLFYWVDTDENYNRWLIINISIIKLQDYLNKKISLYQLITELDAGLVYKVDIDKEIQYHNFELLYIHELPESYLPNKNSLYSFEPLEKQIDLGSYSKKHNQGIFQAYFGNSEKVGYGTIDAELWANSLIQFVAINKGLKKDYINKMKSKAKEDSIKIDIALLKGASTFQYIGNTRNSFGALFKSIGNEISFPGTKSAEDKFVEFIIGFYESSNNIEEFKSYISTLDKKVVNSYRSLLKTITGAKTNFKLNYVNAISEQVINSDIDYKKAKFILQNLELLEFSDTDDIKITGRFTALNLKTGHYEFEDFEDETNRSKGYLDNDRLEMAYRIKWDKTYDVIIKRKEELKTGSKEPKHTDLLISFVEQI
jgi:hypothetical protein